MRQRIKNTEFRLVHWNKCGEIGVISELRN